MIPDGKIYSGTAGSSKSCSVNKYCDNRGSITESNCPDNTVSLGGESYCHIVPPGRTFDGSSYLLTRNKGSTSEREL